MKSTKATTQKYVTGFVLSLALTLVSYFLTVRHINSGHLYPSDHAMVIFLLIFAITQLFVQLVFFLHLGQEEKSRWRSLAFIFAVIIILILVIGSIWIMDNLNYRMSPQQQAQYLKNQDGGL